MHVSPLSHDTPFKDMGGSIKRCVITSETDVANTARIVRKMLATRYREEDGGAPKKYPLTLAYIRLDAWLREFERLSAEARKVKGVVPEFLALLDEVTAECRAVFEKVPKPSQKKLDDRPIRDWTRGEEVVGTYDIDEIIEDVDKLIVVERILES